MRMIYRELETISQYWLLIEFALVAGAVERVTVLRVRFSRFAFPTFLLLLLTDEWANIKWVPRASDLKPLYGM